MGAGLADRVDFTHVGGTVEIDRPADKEEIFFTKPGFCCKLINDDRGVVDPNAGGETTREIGCRRGARYEEEHGEERCPETM